MTPARKEARVLTEKKDPKSDLGALSGLVRA